MHNWQSISEISSSVRGSESTATSMVEKALELLEQNKEFDTVLSVPRDRAFTRAKEIDNSKKGKLAGVPFIAKDNFLSTGSRTTAASKYLKDFEAPYQATAIEKLEAEGAICIAKSNLDAWAHGSSTENSDFFVTKNPHDKTLVPGGSSGGSAAAVALGIVPFAIGTDTGGSVRQPAALSGCIGYKPTYGLISRSGVVAMASSTDTIGAMTLKADDLAEVVDVMAGRDKLDSTTIEREQEGYLLSNSDFKFNEARIGLINEYMSEGLEDRVKTEVESAIDKLRQAGARVEEVNLPSLPLALAVYYIVCPAEVSSNLARYDGQRYGHSSTSAKNLSDSYLLSREEGFGAEAKRRIMIGAHVLSSGYYDAYYKKAQTVRTKIINEFNKAFENFDLLIGPTTPTTAFKIGEKANDPLKMYLNDIMTVAANISGHPAASVPLGVNGGLPAGLQIIAPHRSDRSLLAAVKAFEGLN